MADGGDHVEGAHPWRRDHQLPMVQIAEFFAECWHRDDSAVHLRIKTPERSSALHKTNDRIKTEIAQNCHAVDASLIRQNVEGIGLIRVEHSNTYHPIAVTEKNKDHQTSPL